MAQGSGTQESRDSYPAAQQRQTSLHFAQMVKAYAKARKGKFPEKEVFFDPDWEKARQAAANLLKILPT